MILMVVVFVVTLPMQIIFYLIIVDINKIMKYCGKRNLILKLDTDEPYKHFQDHINIHKEELNSLLRKTKAGREKDTYIWRLYEG